MPIYPSTPAAPVIQIVTAGVISSAAEAAQASSGILKSVSGPLSLAMPHRVAYLPFGKVQPNLILRERAQVGRWRFLVHEKQATAGKEGAASNQMFVPVAAATVSDSERDPQFGDLSFGPFVEGTEQAIRRGEAIPKVRNGRFEALLLMIPSLYAVALWLKDLDGDGDSDLILTIPPAHSDLVPFEPMNPADFISILNQLAREALADAAAR